MGTSRDANDPRDLLRALDKETRAEFEREEADDTGGQEHASRAEREGGRPPKRRGEDAPRAARDEAGAGARDQK